MAVLLFPEDNFMNVRYWHLADISKPSSDIARTCRHVR